MDLHNYSDCARQAINCAQTFAKENKFGCVTSDHLLIGLLSCEGSVAASVLRGAGITQEDAIEKVLSASRLFFADGDQEPVYTKKLTEILESAEETVKERRDGGTVCSEDLLTALIEEQSVNCEGLLRSLGADPDRIAEDLRRYIPAMRALTYEPDRGAGKSRPFIDRYAKDLTAAPEERKTARYIGTGDICERILRVLCRKTKNNPCLVGEPGVGKTAAVEEIARRIAAGEAPQELRRKRIYMLDLPLLLAGTRYRGDFEERVKGVIEEASDPSVILFIDEIHTLIGAGSGEGTLDCANILKPALARGEIRVIGATTFYEYSKYIEKDQALERRFSKIPLAEPGAEDTRQILAGLKTDFEDFHGISITEEALDCVVALSQKHFTDRFFPDKAIDLLDEACAYMRMNKASRILKRGDVEAALRAVQGRGHAAAEEYGEERFISDMTRDVIGQERAIYAIARCLRKTGAQSGRRAPRAVFLLRGPAGSGKNYLSRMLSKHFFHSDDAFFELDLSLCSERQSISRLLGAEPGYVGYGEGGLLSNRIRRKPFTLLLVKNYSLASREVQHLFIRICQSGVIADGQGRNVDFQNSILVFLIGEDRPARVRVGGFGAPNERDKEQAPNESLSAVCDAQIDIELPDRNALEELLHKVATDLQTGTRLDEKSCGEILRKVLTGKRPGYGEAEAFFKNELERYEEKNTE